MPPIAVDVVAGDARDAERISGTPTFAILILTYQRQAFLERALLAHCDLIVRSGALVQLVVSDNHSEDGTSQVVRSVAETYPFVRLIVQPRHFDTAEEHLWHACRALECDFVWPFGDDDLPRPDALERLLPLVRGGRHDFIMTNLRSYISETASIHPGLTDAGGLVGIDHDLEVPIADLVSQVGFITVAACVSASIFRRCLFASGSFPEYFAVSSIYSHVAAYVDDFASSRCYFISNPLVDYTTGATWWSNWERFAQRRRQSTYAPWTIGLVRLLRTLRKRRLVPDNFLYDVVEHNPGQPFRLWSDILHILTVMTENAFVNEGHRQVHDEAALSEIVEEFVLTTKEPDVLNLTSRLKRVITVARTVLGAPGGHAGSERAGAPTMALLSAALDEGTRKRVDGFVTAWVIAEVAMVREELQRPIARDDGPSDIDRHSRP